MQNDKNHLFDSPKNIKIVLYILYCLCAILFGLDFIIHRHVIHGWDKLSGFYAIYGFVGCVVLVLVSKWMRSFLMRSEDYYHEEELKGNEGGDHVDA